MTDIERVAAIEAHRVAHEKKVAKHKANRLQRAERNKKRGLATFVAQLQNNR